jgi:hypothetical protein
MNVINSLKTISSKGEIKLWGTRRFRMEILIVSLKLRMSSVGTDKRRRSTKTVNLTDGQTDKETCIRF